LTVVSCCFVEEIRAALVTVQIRSRLICLTMRESSSTLLKLAFPASSSSLLLVLWPWTLLALDLIYLWEYVSGSFMSDEGIGRNNNSRYHSSSIHGICIIPKNIRSVSNVVKESVCGGNNKLSTEKLSVS
jgi:hypothetical protein